MNIEIISFTGDSGLADYAVSMARALAALANVTVVTADSLPRHFDTMGFQVERVFRRSRNFPTDIIKFIQGVYVRKPDWLIFQGPLKFAGIDALIVYFLRRCGIRCAITVHDVLPHYPRFWSKYEYSLYYRAFDKVIAHSHAAAQQLKNMGIVKPILVVPHGIYDIFHLSGINQQEARSHFPALRPTDTVVLFFGNLESRKGLWTLLDAAEELLATEGAECSGAFKFLIAGAPHLSQSGPGAIERLQKAGNQANIILHAHRIEFEEVERYFTAANIVAMPYLEGTTSGVLKLAIAFNKPVIATTVGDFPEQIPNDVGILIDPDPKQKQLTQALLTMRSNKHLFTNNLHNQNQHAQWPSIAHQVLKHLKAPN